MTVCNGQMCVCLYTYPAYISFCISTHNSILGTVFSQFHVFIYECLTVCVIGPLSPRQPPSHTLTQSQHSWLDDLRFSVFGGLGQPQL